MTVQELVDKLYEYNPDAEVFVCVHNKHIPFTLTYGGGEGVEKENCETVSIDVDGLNSSDKPERPKIRIIPECQSPIKPNN